MQNERELSTMNMKIAEVQERTPELVEKLLAVWQGSVEATHFFLSDAEIAKIKEYVPQALKGVPILVITENDEGEAVGFMGITGQSLEMLFIARECRGQGIGKALLQYGIEHFGVNKLAVNEQNPKAKGFYEHMGFIVYKRMELDEQGEPYPLLYMKKA